MEKEVEVTNFLLGSWFHKVCEKENIFGKPKKKKSHIVLFDIFEYL